VQVSSECRHIGWGKRRLVWKASVVGRALRPSGGIQSTCRRSTDRHSSHPLNACQDFFLALQASPDPHPLPRRAHQLANAYNLLKFARPFRGPKISISAPLLNCPLMKRPDAAWVPRDAARARHQVRIQARERKRHGVRLGTLGPLQVALHMSIQITEIHAARNPMRTCPRTLEWDESSRSVRIGGGKDHPEALSAISRFGYEEGWASTMKIVALRQFRGGAKRTRPRAGPG
jgi:hypothetical protein